MENNQTKKCTKCNIMKDLKYFSKQSIQSDGLKHQCKECDNAFLRTYFRTKKGLITKIYSSQKRNSKARLHNPPSYTITQLTIWLTNQNNFCELYNNWVSSGYKKDLVPSIDRLDDYKPYSLDNIRLVTWEINNIKGKKDRMNGINNKSNKSVGQYQKSGVFIKSFFSIHNASRSLNIEVSNIHKACWNERKSAGGFIWKFLD